MMAGESLRGGAFEVKLVGMGIFAKVVEAKSFSGAARRLGISKSLVSKEVAKLEKALGA